MKARLKNDTETSPTARMLSTHQVIMQMNATITITKSLEFFSVPSIFCHISGQHTKQSD